MDNIILNQTMCPFCGACYKAGEHHDCEKEYPEEKIFVGETKSMDNIEAKLREKSFPMREILQVDYPEYTGNYIPCIHLTDALLVCQEAVAEAKRDGIKEVLFNVESLKMKGDDNDSLFSGDIGYNRALCDLIYLIESIEGDDEIELENTILRDTIKSLEKELGEINDKTTN